MPPSELKSNHRRERVQHDGSDPYLKSIRLLEEADHPETKRDAGEEVIGVARKGGRDPTSVSHLRRENFP